MSVCNAVGISVPPDACLSTNASFSSSPAVKMRPGPFGSFADARSSRRKEPVFFLKLSIEVNFSMSIAMKKWPRGCANVIEKQRS